MCWEGMERQVSTRTVQRVHFRASGKPCRGEGNHTALRRQTDSSQMFCYTRDHETPASQNSTQARSLSVSPEQPLVTSSIPVNNMSTLVTGPNSY